MTNQTNTNASLSAVVPSNNNAPVLNFRRRIFEDPGATSLAEGVNADVVLTDENIHYLTELACKHVLHGWEGIRGDTRTRYMVAMFSKGQPEICLMIMKKATKHAIANHPDPDFEYEDLRYFRVMRSDVVAYCEKAGVV